MTKNNNKQTKKLMSDPNDFIILSLAELLNDIYFNSSDAI